MTHDFIMCPIVSYVRLRNSFFFFIDKNTVEKNIKRFGENEDNDVK